MIRLKKFLKYYDYYLEILAKRISGRGLMDPRTNGEYNLLESIVRNSKDSICFIDGGSNVGEHIIKFDSLCKKYGISKHSIIAVEPFPKTINILRKNTSSISYELIEKALGTDESTIKFYSDGIDGSGSNSALNHYYLNSEDVIEVEQTTIDSIIELYSIPKVNFLKLDIEGFEYNALLGAKSTLSKGIVDYIQLEYNQTWIQGGGSIEKIMQLAESFSYELFRIRKNDLLSITSYNFNLDDFFYCNLLLVKKGCKLPLPSKRKAIPLI